MVRFTLQDLNETLRAAAGDDAADLTASDLDRSFDEIGLDSLVLLHFANCVQKKHGVLIPDDVLTNLGTPRMAIDAVNHQLVKI